MGDLYPTMDTGKAMVSLEQGSGFMQSGVVLRHPFLTYQ